MSDLSQERLEEATGSWAPAIRYLDEVDSTNRVAREWAEEGAPEGCLVVADYQSAGRGRLDRRWFSPPGASLMFSLILRPGIVAADLGLVNLAAGAAVAGAVGELGLEPRLKWPNDVVLDGRKMAGILAEVDVELGRAMSVILGVGINVNISEADFPEELRESATSVARETGNRHERLQLLTAFLRDFTSLYDGMPTQPSERVLEVYRPLCETIGRVVRVELPDRTIEATAVDIDPTGGLILDTGETLRAGDVVHLR